MKRLAIVSLVAVVAFISLALPPGRVARAATGGFHGSAPACRPVGNQLARCFADVALDTTGACVTTGGNHATPDACSHGPADFHAWYNLPCVLHGAVPCGPAGSSFTWNHSQIIGVVDAFNDPTIASDLKFYDSYWGITPCPQGSLSDASACLTILNQKGGTSLPSKTDPGWELETSMDVENVHAMCQDCKIVLIEANTQSQSDLVMAAGNAPKMGATVVSNSYGFPEFAGEQTLDYAYNHPGVAEVVSAGDRQFGTEWPATSPYVVSVGGTTMHCLNDSANQSAAPGTPNCANTATYPNNSQQYGNETVWYDGTSGQGTGSGCSTQGELAQSWQYTQPDWVWTDTVCRANGTNYRGTADVAADADPHTGMAVYDSNPLTVTSNGTTVTESGFIRTGGTSLAAPIIAATYALAGGVPSPAQAAYLPYEHGVYNEGGGSYTVAGGVTSLPANLHDVTYGFNSATCPQTGIDSGTAVYDIMCDAHLGYDGPTGVGTPYGLEAFIAP